MPFHQSSATRPDWPGASAAASSLQHAVHGDAARARLLVVLRRHEVVHEPGEDVAHGRLPRLVAEEPGRMPSSTTPHMPSTTAARSPMTMWQMDVPMTMTMRPGSVTVAAGTETWASTFATATAVPGRSPVQAAASSVSSPALSPMGTIERDIFSSTMPARRGCRAAK